VLTDIRALADHCLMALPNINTDAPQSSQVKIKGPKSTKSQPKCQKTAPPSSPRPVSPIHVESSPSSPEIHTQQAPSPPQPSPQPQETSANVLEQTANPADPIISLVISSEQTSTAPPQGKVHSIKLSPMDLFSKYNHLYYLPDDIVPSATPADQPVIPAASTSQRREIALKQVSYLSSILYIINI